MKHRAVDLLLIVAFLVGGVWAWTSGRERGRLQAQYRELTREAGELSIDDPSQVHVLALETGQPLHFAWRIHVPPNYQHGVRNRSGSLGLMSSGSSQDHIIRVRFRESENGLEIYKSMGSGSSRGKFIHHSVAKLLHGRWDKIRVERLGAGKVATLEPDEQAVLLRLTLPEDIQDEVRKTNDPFAQERLIPVFFELMLGPETPKPKPKSSAPGK